MVLQSIYKFLKAKQKILWSLLLLVGIPVTVYAAVAPSSLRKVDTPSDEECLTFESSQNAFEWQSCTATPLSGDLTLENSEVIDNGTNSTINLGRNDAGTVTLGSIDNDTTASLTIDPGGTATLTLGGAADTVTVAATTGLTLSNSETVSNGTDGTISLTRSDAGTVTVLSADTDATAALTIDAGGTSTLTLGSALDTVLSGADSGYTLANSESIDSDADGTITLGRNDAGTLSITAKDSDATAALTVLPGGAAAFTLGGTSTTATTLVGDDTGDAELVAVVNSVGPADLVGVYRQLIFCGENAENGTIYFGPATGDFGGNGEDASRGGTVCDGLDNATESTADTAISALATKIHGIWCTSDATLGGGETITFVLRTAEGNAATTDGAATTMTCAMAAGETECRVNTGTTTNIAANATLAMQVAQSSNNGDGDETWCSVFVSFP